MPLTVLIVEDEQSAARLLSGIAAEVGLSARTTRSGKEAQDLCAQAAAAGAPFSAVVLDLVLAELDGFQFATAARAQPWGANLPLVVVSGVYKQLPQEFAARVKPAAFFAKPFEPAALRSTLARLTGAQPGAPAMEGELSNKSAAALFVELLRNKASGVLTITHRQQRTNKYTLRNKSNAAKTVLVEQRIEPEFHLAAPEKPAHIRCSPRRWG